VLRLQQEAERLRLKVRACLETVAAALTLSAC
jgi:hypothetical protein